jgi:thymidine kinase
MIVEMALTLIIGPMKSGKSLELIARVTPHKYAQKNILYVHPARNVRDIGITSRIGIEVKSIKVSSFTEITEQFDVIGIDEVHMFSAADIAHIETWLKEGKEVIISGLDVSYNGTLMPSITKLYELKPDTIINKISVCDICHTYNGKFTQILANGEVITSGLSHVVPEDGTYQYQTRCRECFVIA